MQLGLRTAHRCWTRLRQQTHALCSAVHLRPRCAGASSAHALTVRMKRPQMRRRYESWRHSLVKTGFSIAHARAHACSVGHPQPSASSCRPGLASTPHRPRAAAKTTRGEQLGKKGWPMQCTREKRTSIAPQNDEQCELGAADERKEGPYRWLEMQYKTSDARTMEEHLLIFRFVQRMHDHVSFFSALSFFFKVGARRIAFVMYPGPRASRTSSISTSSGAGAFAGADSGVSAAPGPAPAPALTQVRALGRTPSTLQTTAGAPPVGVVGTVGAAVDASDRRGSIESSGGGFVPSHLFRASSAGLTSQGGTNSSTSSSAASPPELSSFRRQLSSDAHLGAARSEDSHNLSGVVFSFVGDAPLARTSELTRVLLMHAAFFYCMAYAQRY